MTDLAELVEEIVRLRDKEFPTYTYEVYALRYCPLCHVGSVEQLCWICTQPTLHGDVLRAMMRLPSDESMRIACTKYAPASQGPIRLEYKEMDHLLPLLGE